MTNREPGANWSDNEVPEANYLPKLCTDDEGCRCRPEWMARGILTSDLLSGKDGDEPMFGPFMKALLEP